MNIVKHFNNRKMNIDQLHKKIHAVDAPPFLFTRIQEKIENAYSTVLPKKFAFALSFSFIFIVVFNAGALVYKTKQNNSVASVAESMNLMPNNDLYTHE